MERYNERSTEYSRRAGATRSRRAKAGLYPSKAQKAAFAKLMQRNGESTLTRDEMLALSTYKPLTVTQREHFAAMAAAQ